MTTTLTARPGARRCRFGRKVRWRDPDKARDRGWAEALGAGPFEVVSAVDHTRHGLAGGLVLRTAMGEREVPEVWLEPAEGPGGASEPPAKVG
jgi:hypothetical protein